MTRLLRKAAVVGVVVAVIVLASSGWLLGSKLVEPQNHAVSLPTGFEALNVSIPGSGHAIARWWVDRGGDSPVVLLLHGVITLGYRESGDVVAARDWIRSRVSRRRIGVIGESMGGASVLLAPQPSGFDAMVLEAVYPRIGRAVENRIRMRLGPLAPVLTPLLLLQLQPRLHLSEADLEPIRSIGRVGAPVMVVAESRDENTTLAESQELFAAASAPKSLWVVEGAKHQDFLRYDPVGYEEHVMGFLKEKLGD